MITQRLSYYKALWKYLPKRACSQTNPNANDPLKIMLKPSKVDKFYLVFSGKYKKSSDIPEFITTSALDKARSLCRIRGGNILMLLGVLYGLLMVKMGKWKAERGETITKINMDWHREEDEKYRKSLENKKSD